MGRPERLKAPGWHHVMANAVDGLVAFEDRHDVWIYERSLAVTVRRYGWVCVSYCFLGTHLHLLLFLDDESLPEGMRLVNTDFARRYNQRRNRRGHALRERYTSVYVDSQAHLLGLFRYIDLNPVRAGLCADPAEWTWGSFRAIMGLAAAPAFLDVDAALKLFGRTPETARAEYERFIRLGLLAA